MSQKKIEIVCKLTSPDLQERKQTLISKIKKLVVERKETADGVCYSFNDSDEVVDLIMAFIKAERKCCPFFVFTLVAGGLEGLIQLQLSGPEGTKEFIEGEIEF